MIFNVEGHIEKIILGEKIQTRRDSGKYEVGKTYAIQPGRGKFADPRGRILITHKWREEGGLTNSEYYIHPSDAEAEGGYSPDEYEKLYWKIHPFWHERWAYEFEFWPTEYFDSIKKALDEAKKHPSVLYTPMMEARRMSKKPDQCTLCGGSFEHNEKTLRFPYPPNHYLCFNCFDKSLNAGLNRLNKLLAGEPLTKEDFHKTNEAKDAG